VSPRSLRPRALKGAALLALALAGWGAARASAAPPDPFDLRAELPAIRENPSLRARLRGSPHGFFRFVNEAFTKEVCRRFEGLKRPQRAVTLHGDCHIEQYAVTELGRGLTDFDDSAMGPAYLDIVRFGVSLRLTARQRGWERDADRVYAAFRAGYRRALIDPEYAAPEPDFAKRVKADFDPDHQHAIARAERLMETLPEHTPEVDQTRRELFRKMLAVNAGLPEWFFHAKKIGRLRIGIGSALSAKYLVRVEGETLLDADDLMLEAKELVDRQGVGCVRIEPGPSRIFTGEARIAYQPFRFPGVLQLDNRTLWVHAWPDNYVELTIQSLKSSTELQQVAYDVGVQLGRGHPKSADATSVGLLRAALLRDLPEAEMRTVIARLTEETIAAWNRFQIEDSAPAR